MQDGRDAVPTLPKEEGQHVVLSLPAALPATLADFVRAYSAKP